MDPYLDINPFMSEDELLEFLIELNKKIDSINDELAKVLDEVNYD